MRSMSSAARGTQSASARKERATTPLVSAGVSPAAPAARGTRSSRDPLAKARPMEGTATGARRRRRRWPVRLAETVLRPSSSSSSSLADASLPESLLSDRSSDTEGEDARISPSVAEAAGSGVGTRDGAGDTEEAELDADAVVDAADEAIAPCCIARTPPSSTAAASDSAGPSAEVGHRLSEHRTQPMPKWLQAVAPAVTARAMRKTAACPMKGARSF
mmetsp:Transcript_2240/g.6498  ORF Transcript_2240/g.6498 Transcript_2240/m.6498 type:complete len:218 (+) Transcript_2240:824-1477(+)